MPLRQSSEIGILNDTMTSSIYSSSSFFDENKENQEQQDHTLEEESPEDENEVEFYCNQLINEQNLDFIILFLQNPKRSGGGDLTSYTLDSNKRILTVRYAKNLYKTRVLTNKVLEFQQYKLIANEPFNKIKFQIDKRSAILGNMPSETALELVQMLAENLVLNDDETNEVEQVVCSQLYKDTFYITYKCEIDLERTRERLHKRNVFKSFSLFLLNAVSTRTIIVSRFDTNNNEVSAEFVELYFMNKKRCGVADYSSMRQTEQYYLITFESEQSAHMVAKSKHVIATQELVVESLYNFDLLKKLNDLPRAKQPNANERTETGLVVGPIENDLNEKEVINQEIKKEETTGTFARTSSDMEPVESSLPSVSDQQQQKVTCTESIERPVIYLTEKSNELFAVLTHWNGKYYDKLVRDLFEIEAAVLKEEPSVVRIECSLDMPKAYDEYMKLKHIWTTNVENYLKKFFSQFKRKFIEIKYPKESLFRIKYDLLRLKIVRLDDKDDLGAVELIGFEKIVDYAENVLANMVFDLNSENEILNKCELEEQNKSIQDNLTDIETEVSECLSDQTDIDSEQVHELTVNLQHESEGVDTQMVHPNVSKKMPADDLVLEFLQKSEQEVSKWLKDMNIACQIEPNIPEKLIQITAADSHEIDRFRLALDEQISTNELDPFSINDKLSERELLNLVQSFGHNNKGVLVKYLDKKIFFCGFNERVDEAFGQCIDNL